MAKGVRNVMSMLGGSSGKQKAAEQQARFQQQIAQVQQAEAVRQGSRQGAEALGQAAKRRRGMLLLDTAGGKATLG